MNKKYNLKMPKVWLILLFPLVYIAFGWWVGLNYGRKPVVFGPYSDIPVVISSNILNTPVKELCGANAVVSLSSPEQVHESRRGWNKTYLNVQGYFELPGRWFFDFQPPYNRSSNYSVVTKTFVLTGSYSRAIARELKNPQSRLGYYSLNELGLFLRSTGRTGDLEKLRPYALLADFEEKYPYLYSETVLLSKAMGNIFSDNWLPYDIFGLLGICILFIVLFTRNVWLWQYYLCWVFSYWFGRIGFHDPNLAFSREGWQIIFWSFWHGFIQKEGRLFLVIVLGVSAAAFGVLLLIYLYKKIFSAKDTIWKTFKSVDRKVNRYAF